MITWARGIVLILIGASIGMAVWHSSSSRAIEAERQRLGAVDDYQAALSRFVNGDLAVMQIEAMKNDKKRLGNLLPPVFADARPLVEEAARRSAVVIRDYTEGAEQKRVFVKSCG